MGMPILTLSKEMFNSHGWELRLWGSGNPVQNRYATNRRSGKLTARTRRSDQLGVTAHSRGGTLGIAFLRRGIEQIDQLEIMCESPM